MHRETPARVVRREVPRAREEEKDISERERNLRAYKGITAVSNAASNVRIRHRLRSLLFIPGSWDLAFGIFHQTLWLAAFNI